jgi:hypothetical protein
VARIASLCAAGVGLALVPIFARNRSIYQAHGMFTAAVTPPIVVAILLGALWKRYSPAAAFTTLVGGGALVALSFIWPETLVKPFAFGMGPDSYKFMRALYGLVASGLLGLIVGLFTRPRPLSEIAGLVTGTQLEAMRRFKGGEVNRRPGRKCRLAVAVDPSLGDSDAADVPPSAMAAMAADPGDMLYACDTRWWLGGLRSVHLRAGGAADDGRIRIGPESAATAHFSDGQTVVVEKIL